MTEGKDELDAQAAIARAQDRAKLARWAGIGAGAALVSAALAAAVLYATRAKPAEPKRRRPVEAED